MELKNKSIEEFYESIEENFRLKRKNANKIEFLTTVEYLNKYLKPNSKILDACAGGGIYSFYFADKGHHVYAGDLIEKNVEDIKNNQEEHLSLNDIFVGSILDLQRYDTESFDMVLNLGSYYHLIEKNKRKKSIEESLRVLKKGGIYAIAYVNRYSNVIKFRDMFTRDFNLLQDYIDKGYHSKNEVFYCSTPKLIEEELSKFDLAILHHIATDGMKFIIGDVVNELNEDGFNKWMKFHLSTCEDVSILGSSEHGLIIARKL